MSRPPDLTEGPTTDVVVLVLENNQGDVLLTQRRAETHLPFYWEFPGGKAEPNETRLETLRRECLEEIGYTPSKAKEILTIHHTYPTKSVQIFVFHELAHHPIVKPLENQNMQWVPKNQLNQHQLPAANKGIIDYLN